MVFSGSASPGTIPGVPQMDPNMKWVRTQPRRFPLSTSLLVDLPSRRVWGMLPH